MATTAVRAPSHVLVPMDGSPLAGDASVRAEAADQAVETAVETGKPAETILEYVENHDVDHVVMGGHGGERGRVARRLLGTAATAVIGGVPVSVTVVR